jgi:hypothetical protein
MINGKKRIFSEGLVILSIILLLSTCSSIQAGLYSFFVDHNSGETILQNEKNVSALLEDIAASWENYTVRTFAITAINYQVKRTKLMTHSFFVFIRNNGEYHTLSFFYFFFSSSSTGALVVDTDMDTIS